MPRDGGLNSSVGPNWRISLTFIATTLTAVATASMLGSLLPSCTQQAVLRWEQRAPNFPPLAYRTPSVHPGLLQGLAAPLGHRLQAEMGGLTKLPQK